MNKNITLILVLALLAAACTITPLPVEAVPRTIIVPDDYPTIAEAIENAAEGDTVFVKKGTYEEHSIVTNKTISLVGENKDNTVIRNIDVITYTGPLGIPNETVTIRISANNVKISGFTITNGTFNIAVTGHQTQIIGNIITSTDQRWGRISLEGSNNTVAENTLTTTIQCSGSYNSIAANKIAGGNGGIQLDGPFNLVHGNALTDANYLGGISVNGDGNIVAKNNLNNSGGIHIEGSGSSNIVCANKINDGGLAVTGYNNTFYTNEAYGIGSRNDAAPNNIFYHNNFLDIRQNINIRAWRRVIGPLFWDNGEEGNFWSDYNGTDADGDGVGDTPYVIDPQNRDRYPLMQIGATPPTATPKMPVETIIAAIALPIITVAVIAYSKRRKKKTAESNLQS